MPHAESTHQPFWSYALGSLANVARSYAEFLLLGLVVYLFFLRPRGQPLSLVKALRHLLPSEIYTHRSFRVDLLWLPFSWVMNFLVFAGLTLGAGFGRVARRYGLALDNVKAVDIVSADGQLRHASRNENPDLHWAVRGGGGNFGVVTSWFYKPKEAIEDKQALAYNIFLFGQCMEGTQFYGLFGMILSLYRQNKFPGIGQMFRYTLRDESNHIEVFRNLFMDLVDENREIWTPEFKEELRQTMAEAIQLEKDFIRDCLPLNGLGLSSKEFEQYIDYIADRRLRNCGLDPLVAETVNPFPWLSEMMDLKKEQNFFEGRVTEYQKSSSLNVAADDEL